jgi:hypothetical protein
MKQRFALNFGVLLLLSLHLIACQRQNNVCPPVEGTPTPKPALADLITLPPPQSQMNPTTAEIGGKVITVDKFVDYPLCNDTWSGTVYVSCKAQVAEAASDADDNPLFFKGCNLEIESGTVVYVAAHNDAAYYKGCSCHTGTDPIP